MPRAAHAAELNMSAILQHVQSFLQHNDRCFLLEFLGTLADASNAVNTAGIAGAGQDRDQQTSASAASCKQLVTDVLQVKYR